MKIKFVKKNQVVVYKDLIDGLYRNLDKKEKRIEVIEKLLEERRIKDAEQMIALNGLEKKWKEFHAKFDTQLDESLALAAEVAQLRAENEMLKKSNKSLKGYATKCKNKFEVIQGRKK